MPSLAAEPADPRPSTPPPALGRQAARGFFWMLAQTVVTKGLGIAGQIAVAWYLSVHDFKLIFLTYAVTGFPNLIRDAGLQTILVQRGRHLSRWIVPGFWMSVALGLLAWALMGAMAPVAAAIFKEPELIKLISLIGLGSLLGSLGTVPNAAVQVQLRFRFQAVLTLIVAVLTIALSVLLAWRGWGPYSSLIPNVVSNGLRTAILWVIAAPAIRWRLHLRRWRYLMTDNAVLILAGSVWMLISQGDNLILGWLHPLKTDDTVGIFGFSFNLSWQTLVLLTVNVAGVLLPSLAKLQNDPPRQVQAYLRSSRLLALVAVPTCLLQAAVTAPGFYLVIKPKLYPAIHVTEVLCLVMAIRCVAMTWMTFAQSQGRFSIYLKLNAIFCVFFLASVAVAAHFGGALTVATTEAVFFTIVDPLGMYVMLRLNKVDAGRELVRVFFVPFIATGVAVGVGYLAGRLIPEFSGANLVKIVVITLISIGLYLPIVRKLASGDWNDLLSMLRRRTVPAV